MIVAADATLDPLQALVVNGGIIGVFMVLLMIGQLYTGKSVQRERDVAEAQLARQDAERARVELESARRQAMIDTLLAVYHDEILPTLADYEKKLAPTLANVVEIIRRMEWIIGEYERRGRGAEESPWYPTGAARGPADMSLVTAIEVASVKAQAQALTSHLKAALVDIYGDVDRLGDLLDQLPGEEVGDAGGGPGAEG